MPVEYVQLETAETIHRDVMDQLYDVYPTEREFTGDIDEHSVDSNYTEWAEDEIAAPAIGAERVDGSTSTGNDASTGSVVGNRVQINTRKIRISDGAQAVNSVGNIGTLGHQIARRQQELYRDIEANSLTEFGSVADDGVSTGGRSAGYFAWIKTNYRIPAAGASVGGFSNGVVSSYTPGAARPLSMTWVKEVTNEIFEQGERADCLVTRPKIKAAISDFLFSSSARISTMYAEAGQSPKDLTAQGSIGIYHTDHGTLELRSNPVMQDAAAGRAHVGVYTRDFWALGFLDGPVTRPLARDGLADNREVIAYWCLKCLNERASGMVTDIDPDAAVIQ